MGKQKKSPIVLILVVIGIGVLLYFWDDLEETTVTVPAPKIKLKKKNKRKVVPTVKIAPALKTKEKIVEEEAEKPAPISPTDFTLSSFDKDQEVEKKDETGEVAPEDKEDIREKEKIPEEIQFTPAPDYQAVGRGLVYNCLNKHWSCIDRNSFFQCKKHRKWSEKNGQTVACVEVSVFASDYDCGLAQARKIEEAKAIDFCE